METIQQPPIQIVDIQETPKSAWLVTFVAALFFFYEFIQGTMFNSMAEPLMRAFEMDAEQLGYLSGMHYLANVLFLFPAGMMLDRFSTKRLILIAMYISVIATFLLAMTSNYYLALICRFLTGIGAAFCLLSCFRLATRWFPTKRMALVTGLIVTMAMTGGMVAQTPMTLLVEAAGWREAIMVDAVIGLLFIVLISIYVSDYPPGKEAEVVAQRKQLSQIGFWSGLRQSYFNLQNISAAIYTSLMNTPVGILGALIGSLYLQQVYGFSALEASYASMCIFIGTIIGGPSVGWISDTIGRRRLPMIIGALASLALIFLMLNAENWALWQWMLMFFALGLSTSTQVISYPTVAESNSLVLTATSVSVVSIITQGGIAVLQPYFGRLLQTHWDGELINGAPLYAATDYAYAMTMIPMGFVIALIAALLVKETYCRRQ